MDEARLRDLARIWSHRDPDGPEAAQRLLDGPIEALQRAFGHLPRFGTGGVRGPRGVGPAHLNRLVVRHLAHAVLTELLTAPEARARGVVVVHDSRLEGAAFADEVCGVLAPAGVRVWRSEGPAPTPLLSFAVRHLGAAAGVAITASHNPPEDQGFKLYDATGAQVVPPLDAALEAAVARTLFGPSLPVDPAHPGIAPLDPGVRRAWHAAAEATAPGASSGTSVVVTPLHGAGGRDLVDVLSRRHAVATVPEQHPPDGRFPTVASPNPEDPAALARACLEADRRGVDLVLAVDPDADRLAAAVRGPGGWEPLGGNLQGAILADALLARATGPRPTVVTTAVSTRLLDRVAADHGAEVVRVPTGFKWIARRGLALPGDGRTWVVGVEESFGYGFPGHVRDKDGVTAALCFADLHAQAGGLLGARDALHRRHGVHVDALRSLRVEDPARRDAQLARLRAGPPEDLGGHEVVGWRDHADGRTGGRAAPDAVRANLLTLHLADGGTVRVRPSGTEPKLKLYGEWALPPGGDLARDRATGRARLASALDELAALVG